MSLSFFDSLLKSEHNRLILWLPVGIAIGIGWYFSLKSEPDFFYLAFLLMIVISLFLFKNMRIMAFIASVVSIGFCAVWLKSSLLSTHQIKEEIGPLSFSGVIEKVDEKASALRLTISSLEFEDDHMPSLARVRLTCRGKKMLSLGLSPGQMVMLRAVLLPAQGPPHPYGYNFRRQAYFEGLSAVGYCTSLPKIIEESQNNHIISKLRYNLTKMLRNNIGGTPGEIAAALVTGDRSGIPDSIRQIYADSGIAHVLAISGLHLSLVAGFFFVFLRLIMAGIPILALRYNTKKLAAFFAIIGVMLYLVVCGAPIPALRAFIMTSLILGAVMLDRFAISLRNVAIAATFILIFIPEALLSPSFQLSFAAVTVLVAGYERYYTSLQSWIARKPWLGKTVCVYFFGVILSTVLSTIATTPYVIYTFHHFTLHSIPANMIVIPLISFFIMPLLAVYIIFWPITESMGLSSVLHYLLNTMTDIATYVAGWQGSHILVRSMPIESLLLATFGLLLFFLVKHMLRFVGLGLMFFSAIYMFYADLPWAFIGKKSLIGIYDIENGIQVNSLSKERFARKSWMSFCGLDKVRKNQNILADNHDLKAFLEKHHDLRSAYIWRNGNELKCTSVQDTEGVRPWSL